MRRFQPSYVSVFDLQRAKELRERTSDLGIEVFEGTNGACVIASLPEVDLVLSAIVGGAGLAPTLSAIRAGRDVAIANKEPLVMAGELVMRGHRAAYVSFPSIANITLFFKPYAVIIRAMSGVYS